MSKNHLSDDELRYLNISHKTKNAIIPLQTSVEKFELTIFSL